MLTVKPDSRQNLSDVRNHDHCGEDKGCFWIRALYSGLPPRLKRRLRVAVLQAFFDDSGRGKLEPKNLVFVLAGYTGSVDAFASFAHKWDDLLKEEPCLEYVKGKEANDLAEQFAGWTCEARDKKIAAFISLIREHELIALSIAMDYRAFNRHLREPKAPMNYPYGITFAHVVTWLLKSAALKPEPEEIELIFDNGMIGRQRSIDAAYKGIQEGIPPDVLKYLVRGKPRFEDDKRFMPLQAADLLAWNCRRDYMEQLTNKRRWESPTWNDLRTGIKGKALYFGERELLEMKNEKLAFIVRKELARKIVLNENLKK
jgi:Protein of unknown function (DUF3800)